MDPHPRALRDLLVDSVLPVWVERGVNPAGGFHERLDARLAPQPLGYTRLVSQCRQVFAFGELALLGGREPAREAALGGYEHVRAAYRAPGGGWVFALGDHPSVPAGTRDLYAHAFVLLASATVLRLRGPEDARATARETLDFVRERFRARHGGYHEALDVALAPVPRVRRQNPHMHLVEGCLAMHAATGEAEYLHTADELFALFTSRFYDSRTRTLGEFFDDAWTSHPGKGHVVEPGHHFEWIWLLSLRLALAEAPRSVTKASLSATRDGLYAFALEHGEDREHGGFWDAVDRTGRVISDTKRIWPATEALKACAHAGPRDGGRWEALLERTLKLLLTRYLIGASGAWNEVLARDLSPATDHLPATTLYHLVMGCRETLSALGEK